MDSALLEQLSDLTGARSVAEWLELPEVYAAVDGLAALGRKTRWAQAALNNPRHERQARWVLRNKAALRELVETQAGSSSALAPPPPQAMPDLQTEEAIKAYWEGLKLAGDLQTEERWNKLTDHARDLGMDEEGVRGLLGDPQAIRDLADAISEIRGDVRVPPSAMEQALAQANDARDALKRLRALQNPPKPDQAHRRDLLDGLRGLLLQDALTHSTKDALIRTAQKRGLSPVRARSLIQAAVNAWYSYRTGQANPYRVLGVASTADKERARKAYRRTRQGLMVQDLSWERMQDIAKADAAWAVVARRG